MKETDIYKRLGKLLKNKKKMFQRIEQSRVPDIYFSLEQNRGFIEVKVIKSMGMRFKVPFRPGQYLWLRHHHETGGESFLFIYCETSEALYVFKNKNIQQEYTYSEVLHKNYDIINWEELEEEKLIDILCF